MISIARNQSIARLYQEVLLRVHIIKTRIEESNGKSIEQKVLTLEHCSAVAFMKLPYSLHLYESSWQFFNLIFPLKIFAISSYQIHCLIHVGAMACSTLSLRRNTPLDDNFFPLSNWKWMNRLLWWRRNWWKIRKLDGSLEWMCSINAKDDWDWWYWLWS